MCDVIPPAPAEETTRSSTRPVGTWNALRRKHLPVTQDRSKVPLQDSHPLQDSKGFFSAEAGHANGERTARG
jgi:hypothetical protein